MPVTYLLNRALLFIFGIAIFFLPFLRFLFDGWSNYLFFSLTLLLLLIHCLRSLVYKREFLIFYGSLPLSLFWIFFILSSYFSPFKELARIQILSFLNATLFFLLIQELNEAEQLKIKKLLFLSLSLFLFAFILTPFITPIIPYKDEFFLKSNFVSSIGILVLFLGLDILPKKNLFTLFLAIFVSIIFIMTKSFASLGGLLLSFLYIGISKRNTLRSNVHPWILPLMLGGGIVSVLLIVNIGSWRPQSLLHRWEWWSIAKTISFKAPFFGSGPGSFEKMSMGLFSRGETQSLFVHNFPLQIASECGIPASLCLLLFILKQIFNKNKLFLAGGALALFTQNLFDYPLNIAGLFLLLFLLLGFNASPEKKVLLNFKTGPFIFLGILPILFWVGWNFSIRPLLSFEKTVTAEESFKKGDLTGTELHLRQAVQWDPLATDPLLNLSELLLLKKDKVNEKEALLLQKKALKIDPTALKYRKNISVQ